MLGRQVQRLHSLGVGNVHVATKGTQGLQVMIIIVKIMMIIVIKIIIIYIMGTSTLQAKAHRVCKFNVFKIFS